ncbi:related to CAP59 (required for capsule formation) [Sporisorium reilianum SRZ2]|uniref:Related to CAP59 (Required for capsule formation) n=1 Tax=Sporisorium reilianum (strain SRZ2) TaxID=999809 RepID=E7A2T6_SPORE|nr:related to CAP59 (required for capsule formation) [Sporisorium reilianum SRZ2]
MLHVHSQKVPLLPLQADGPPYEPLAVSAAAADDDLLYHSKHHWTSAPWARRLGGLADRSSSGLVPTLVWLPLLVSIFAHIYFRMFSTLHIFLALVWIGLPAATVSTLATIASRYYSNSSTRRDHLKAAVLVALVCTVAWRTFTTSPYRGLSDFSQAPANNETVFIAVNLYNSEHLFPAFSDSLLELVDHLGNDNVYISIYESNSHDRTKQLLSLLQHDLQLRGIQNSIRMLDNNRRQDMDRIERLAIIRNEALNPIQAGVHGLHGRTFSKLIWLNDIFFRPESVLELLSTNEGHFDQVCALDYLPLGFYDTWVMRDVQSERPTPLWPYFKLESDIAALRKGDIIPVNSCWNGMTVFDAKWFLPTGVDGSRNTSAHPGVDDGPIRFRTHPECLASECLLPSYDIHVRSKQRPLIFVNPKAVATYQWRDYYMYDCIMRSNIVNLWSRIWQDLISHQLFGFLIEIGRKKDDCAETLRSGWKKLL